jgi:hypothetical protein
VDVSSRARLARILSFVAFAALGVSAVPIPAPAQTPPLSATDVYVKMRAAVNALPVPAYIAFTQQDDSSRKYSLLQDRMRIVVRSSDDRAWVHTIKDANGNPSRVPPYVVTNRSYPGTPILHAGDFPLADFGLRPRRAGRPGMFEAPGTPEPVPSGAALQAIGSVRSYNLSYRITDLGDTEAGGTPVYHLGLVPVRDPGHNVLREVWIDKGSFIPKRFVAERFVDDPPLVFRYLITVETALIGGHLVNVDAVGDFDVHRALIVHYAGHSHWTISDVTFPADPPWWLFDPERYKDHKGEAVPDL